MACWAAACVWLTCVCHTLHTAVAMLQLRCGCCREAQTRTACLVRLLCSIGPQRVRIVAAQVFQQQQQVSRCCLSGMWGPPVRVLSPTCHLVLIRLPEDAHASCKCDG
jgi:hypothetical protein